MEKLFNERKSEYGGAGVKLLFALFILIILAHAGFNYVPVAYQGLSFRQEMEAAVVQGTVVPMIKKTPLDAVRYNLDRAAKANGIPETALIEAKQIGNTIQGHVFYSRDVNILPFGLWVYTYDFDYTVVPTGYLAKN